MTPTTATPSLQRRVVIAVLAFLAVLLVVLGVVIDLLIGAQARRDLNDRLQAGVSRVDALARAGAPPWQWAAEVDGGGIRAAVVTADGERYGDPAINPDIVIGQDVPPPPPPRPPGRDRGPGRPDGPRPPPPPDATATAVDHVLPDGSRLILVADTTATSALLRQLRILMVVAGIAVLVITAVGVALIARTTMLPLTRLTDVAESIAAGDRGRRMRPDRPGTELGRAAQAFDTMVDALEYSENRAHTSAQAASHAEASTRRFLADAAHELRTPIAGILAAADQIVSSAVQRDDPESDRQRHRAELVLSEARRAGRLVADMLDLSRIDAGSPLDLQPCDLAALADAERDRSAVLAPGLEIRRSGDTTLPVLADPLRIAQILANVVDNARRHTPPGGTVAIDARAVGGRAVLTVTDTGTGVPDDQRDHIFERLVRLDEARDRDRGGAGLGLPIARALARAHGGDLVNVPHRPGARFVLTLPLRQPAGGG
ncbi:two-component sensor histidine kinase [Mycolicibacterium chubuense]|uniref:histidine kinase n=1 Tax=Mycolicibacterium chubuense TaxID=1800 RepID=A0A0J6VVG2_MYCCU|nr:HAMP domain-containing sensor histidine kinase [Mycolicibacterium chubuense]KMO74119.1 putative sensor histidine kinase TcrY [Mycolicibacterium chubuense]ORA42617.1 two-component sensor histidine kinase [Mycolicibacterium chubuense]SPX97862.1 two-component regulator - sensor kinase [Mycolicibacterium chubuense]